MYLENVIFTKEEARKALLGTIVSDGSLCKQRTNGNRSKPNADLEVTHTSKNLDYLKFKKDLLAAAGIESRISEHNKKTPEKTYMLYRLLTERHPWLTEQRDILYDSNRKKLLPQSVLGEFTDLSLLLMYLDDGTLRIKCYEGTSRIRECRATICTDRFTLSEVENFQKYLKEKYNIDSRHYRHSKNMSADRGFRIWMNTENTNKLMSVFDKYYELIPSMKYKYVRYYLL